MSLAEEESEPEKRLVGLRQARCAAGNKVKPKATLHDSTPQLLLACTMPSLLKTGTTWCLTEKNLWKKQKSSPMNLSISSRATFTSTEPRQMGKLNPVLLSSVNKGYLIQNICPRTNYGRRHIKWNGKECLLSLRYH